MFEKKDLKLLGLTENENTVLKALQGELRSPSFLSGILEIPRTTIAFLLKKLEKRGLVQKIKTGGRFKWKAASETELAHNLRRLSNRLDPLTALFEITAGKRESEIEIYRGKERMKDAIQKVLKVGRGKRVYSVQGNRTLGIAIEKFEWEFLFDYHEILKRRGIIMEGVAGESALEILKTLSRNQLESHLGRLTVVYLGPDKFFDFSGDLIVFQNIVMVINYEEETVLLIKDSKIQRMLQNMISFMEKGARKIDLNKYIRELLEKTK